MSEDEMLGEEATTSQGALPGGEQARAEGAEAQLLWTDMEILGMLPKIKLQALAREVGVDTRGTTAQILERVKAWRKERVDVGRQGPPAPSGQSAPGTAGPARRPGKRRRTVLCSEDEEGEVFEEEEDGLDDQGGEDGWPAEDDAGGRTPRGRARRRPVREVFSTSQARQLSELLRKAVEGDRVVDRSILAEVGRLTTSYNQLKRETEAERTWPEVKMETPRNQHEYDFIMRVGRILTGADVDDLAELRKAVGEAIQELKRRGAQVITGDRDGWTAAAKLQRTAGSFLDEFAEEIAAARRAASEENRKSTAKNFRSKDKSGGKAPKDGVGQPPGQWVDERLAPERRLGHRHGEWTRHIDGSKRRSQCRTRANRRGECGQRPPQEDEERGLLHVWQQGALRARVPKKVPGLEGRSRVVEAEASKEEAGVEEVSEGEPSEEEASEEAGEEEARKEVASAMEAGRVEVSGEEVGGEESKRAWTNAECASGGAVETAEEINVVGSLGRNVDEWRKIGATEQVLAWVAHGLPLTLLREVIEDRRVYRFDSEQVVWLDAELGRLLRHKAIECVGESDVRPPEVRFVSPVFLVPKKGPKRWRLVIDMRAINKALAERRCKFEGLASLARIAGKNWWMITFDLAQGYHHVEIEQEARVLLGFRVGRRWFRYRVMPFGLRCSPWAFTKIVRCMLREWRRNGVFVTAYLDDFVVLAPSREEVLRVRDDVIEPLLRRLGWWREPSKGCWEPAQEAEVLGLVVDLRMGQFRVPEGKMQRAEELCEANDRPTRTRRELAQVAGAVNALRRAVPIVPIFLRRIYQLVGKDRHGWNRCVCLPDEARADLRWLRANMRRRQGGLIWRPSTVLTVRTDASGYGWGGCLPECCQEARGSFGTEEMRWRIHRKEMWAVLGTVLAQRERFAGRQVEFQSDNMMVVRYLREGGGSDRWMTDIVRRVWQLLDAVGAKIYTAAWIRGATENRWADFLSRWKDPDDWRLSDLAKRRILEAFGPWDVDRFADDLSATVPAFNSRFATPGTAGVDAFTQDWSEGTSLLVPPIGLIGRALAHAIECAAGAAAGRADRGDGARPVRKVRARQEPELGVASLSDRRQEGSRVEDLRRVVEELLSRARAPSTLRTYERWCADFDEFVASVPGACGGSVAERLALFVAELHGQRRGGVARVAACAVAFREARTGQPSPLADRRLALVLDAVDREWAAAAARRARDPFPVEALRAWVRAHDGRWTMLAARDAALVAVGLRAMRRASELAALRWSDVVRAEDGVVRIHVARSKTDQCARGHDIFLEPTGGRCCPVRLLLEVYGRLVRRKTGLLFASRAGAPMSSSAISAVCRRMVAAAGVKAAVSSHSLRIGGATAAMEGGLSKEQIMAIGGWRSSAVERYLRAREVTVAQASRRMGL